MKSVMLLISVLFAILFSCTTNEAPQPAMITPDVPDMGTPPNHSDMNTMGTFVGYAHSLAGAAVLSIDSTDTKTLTLENFTMTAGSDVYVYVSKSNNYSKANVIEVAKLTAAFSKNVLNFNVTSPNYTKDYKFVLVYCVQFNSLFGYAELK